MLDLKSLVPWGQKSENVPGARQDRSDPFKSFRTEIDRVFDDFFNTGFGLAKHNGSNGWSNLTPQIDVKETEKEIVVTAEIAGVDEKDLDVTLSGDVLTFKGEKKHENETNENGYHHVERHFGSFSRSVRLPFEAGEQEIDADVKNGVLTVKIPKPEDFQQKVKRIEIKAA